MPHIWTGSSLTWISEDVAKALKQDEWEKKKLELEKAMRKQTQEMKFLKGFERKKRK